VAAVPVAPAKARGSTLVITGDLTASEDLTFEGRIDGTISLPDHVLTIGAEAQVSAQLTARVVVLQGTLTGNVSAFDRMEIKASGRMEGDLISPKVQIADGATFRGRLETRKPGKPSARTISNTSALVA
jgi:cytoskeletal protein CcmA (bactofilin family)